MPQRCLCLREYRFFFEALSRERESREANAPNISYIYSRQISAPIPIFYIWNDPALDLGVGGNLGVFPMSVSAEGMTLCS